MTRRNAKARGFEALAVEVPLHHEACSQEPHGVHLPGDDVPPRAGPPPRPRHRATDTVRRLRAFAAAGAAPFAELNGFMAGR